MAALARTGPGKALGFGAKDSPAWKFWTSPRLAKVLDSDYKALEDGSLAKTFVDTYHELATHFGSKQIALSAINDVIAKNEKLADRPEDILALLNAQLVTLKAPVNSSIFMAPAE